jgi:Fe-S cluster assembly scaffold protein SufB
MDSTNLTIEASKSALQVVDKPCRLSVDVEAGASLQLCLLAPCTLHAAVADGATLHISLVMLTDLDEARNTIDVDINGQNADVTVNGMAIVSGSQHVSAATNVRHHSEHSHSNQLFKYVVGGKATGEFLGKIVVDEAARFTEAYQSNRNILASETARMHAEPALEIYCDEVKCSHGATTGQLDETALFYMRTRGIPQDEARRMLMEAFMADVIATLPDEELRERVSQLAESKFGKVYNQQ